MRKHELVHLHALARTVADHLIDGDDLDPAAMAAYRDRGVTPMSLQASRDAHEGALLALVAAIADGIAPTVDSDGDGSDPAGSDGDGDTERPEPTAEDLAEASEGPSN